MADFWGGRIGGALTDLGQEATRVWGGGMPQDPSSPAKIERRRKMTDALLGNATDTGPVPGTGGWDSLSQGMSRVVSGLAYGRRNYVTDEQERLGEQAASDEYRKMLEGGVTKDELAGFMNNPFATEAQQKGAALMVPDSTWRPLSAEEKVQFGVPPGDPYMINDTTHEVKAIKPPSGTTINMPGASEQTGGVLAESIGGDYRIVMDNFDSLADLTSQFGTAAENVPGLGMVSKYMQTQEYKRTKNALMNIAWMHAYATTGAALSPTELIQKVEGILPAPNDGPEVRADKKNRITYMVNAINAKSGRAAGKVDTSEPPAAAKPKFEEIQDNSADIPEGAIVRDTTTGQLLVKQGGKLVPAGK
jgi:hypothetical protein